MEAQDQRKKELKITVPAGVTAELRTGYISDAGDAVAHTGVTEDGETRVYTFAGLPAGAYGCLLSGEGFYTVERRLWIAPDGQDKIAVSEDPGRTVGNGYEQTVPIRLFTPEAEEKLLPSDPALWPEYADAFQTPSFGANKGKHEIASNEEMLAFLREKTAASRHARLYSLGKSSSGKYEMPIVVCTETDLTGADTLEEAARRIRADGKVTVHYNGQIHGNEPAGGEGATAIAAALCGPYGDGILKNINVYIVPRVNPDGAERFIRKNAVNDCDMNRDHLLAQSVEIRNLHRAIGLFLPEIVIDAHEFTVKSSAKQGHCRDVMLRVDGGINVGKEIREFGLPLLTAMIRRLADFGLRAVAYPDAIFKSGNLMANSMNPTGGSTYNSLFGALSILVETRGIRAGKANYHRRVVSQFITAETVLKWAAQNAAELQRVVRAERDRIVEAGRRYAEDRRFVIETKSSYSGETALPMADPTFDLLTGDPVKPEDVSRVCFYDLAVRSRPFPTAYLIPKGEPWSEDVLEIAGRHFITHTELAPGAAVSVRQSLGSVQEIALSPEHPVTFPNGAYVFSMAQPNALYLACLMEADLTDAVGRGSLAQMGVIPEGDGLFPIYRYVRDLEADGSVALL